MLQLREADDSDIEAIAALLAQLFAIEADFHADAEHQLAGLRKLRAEGGRNLLLVALGGSEVIGFCSVQRLVSTAEGGEVGLLEDLIVDEAHRGAGVGSQLLQRAEAWAREQGLSRLQLLADAENTAALDFYRRHHWSTTQLLALRRSL